MKPELEKYLKKLSKENLIKIQTEFNTGKYELVNQISEYIILEFGIDPILASTIVRNKIQEILANKYVKFLKLKNIKKVKK
jgi:hypothetical protein